MFGQMTVFLAAAGGVLIQTLNKDTTESAVRVLGAIGVAICAVFLIHHERMYDHSYRARASAIDAQEKLGIVVYHHSTGPYSRLSKIVPRAAIMSRLLYLLTMAVFSAIVIVGSIAGSEN